MWTPALTHEAGMYDVNPVAIATVTIIVYVIDLYIARF